MILEESLVQDKNIAVAIVFGRQRFELGVLLVPAADAYVSDGDKKALEDFLDLIWWAETWPSAAQTDMFIRPTVEKMNANSLPFARLRRKVSARH